MSDYTNVYTKAEVSWHDVFTGKVDPGNLETHIDQIDDGLYTALGSIATAVASKVDKSTFVEQGDIMYASAASTPAILTHGTAGQVLQSGGNAANPSWLSLGTMAAATATDYVAKATFVEQGDILYASAASTPAVLTHGTAGDLLQSGGNAANPSWIAASTFALAGHTQVLASGATDVTATYAEVNAACDNILTSAVITVGEIATRTFTVGIQLNNGAAVAMNHATAMFAYLSDNAAGDNLIAAALSTAPAIATNGLMIPVVADKAWQLVSESNGTIGLTLTEAAAKTCYLVLVTPRGDLSISTAIVFPSAG
jgi:hypothetical protein